MQPKVHLVEGDMPEYPADLCDPALTSDYFTKFWHDRWLSSALHLRGSLAVQGAALNLFFYARKQVPVGSLPRDEEMLARLLRISLDEWRGLMAQAITPLHNWVLYSYRDDVVLGHEVVIEVARDALNRREDRKASNEARAVAMRRKRLAEDMAKIGCDKKMCADEVLIAKLDDWLVEHHHGQRRMPQFERSLQRALAHAVQEGWIGGQMRGR